MLKQLFCTVLITMSTSLFAKDLKINLKALQWHPSRNSSNQVTFTPDGAILMFDGKQKGQVEKGGVWINAETIKNIRLNDYGYLLFQAHSKDGKSRPLTIYLRRRLSPSDNAEFYTIIELTPEWRDYNLKLERGDRVNFGQGIFALRKTSPNGNSDLSAGGELLGLTYAVSEPAHIELKNLRLGPDPVDPNSKKIKEIATKIKRHAKFIPYSLPVKKGAKRFSLASDGKTGYCIQAPSDAVSRFAAGELAKYLQRVTGAEFPDDNSKKHKHFIRLEIGNRKPADGFSIAVDPDGNIRINGNNARGLVYGVYDFLERVAGCRFFGPFDYLEVVPQNRNLTVCEFSLSDAPTMSYRFPHYCNDTRVPGALEHIYAMADYCTKNRYNVELQKFDFAYGQTPREPRSREFYGKRGGIIPLPEHWGHNLHTWLPPENFFPRHKEYYCYDRATKQWRADRAQLCTTNPEVAQRLAEIAEKQFAARKELTHFGVFQEDGHRLWCQCDKCLAVNPSGSNLNSATDNNLYLANAVAERIGPEKRVMTYAYSITNSPPKVVKPLPNVDILYCQYGGSDPRNKIWDDIIGSELLTWSKLAEGNLNLYTYNYRTPFYSSFSDANSHIAAFRYYDLLGIHGTTQEMCVDWTAVNPYLYYLSARLAWNPWFDETAFRKDYFEKLYGNAGSIMEELYLRLDRSLSERENKIPLNEWHAYVAIPEKELNICRELLKRALAITKDSPRIQAAVKIQKISLEYLELVSHALHAIRSYRLNSDKTKHNAAVASVNTMGKKIQFMIGQHLVYPTHLTLLRRIIEEIASKALADNAFERKYRIVSRLENGWKFLPDPNGNGEKRNFSAAGFDDGKWHPIKVGKSWEKQGFPNYDGAAWYRLKLTIPKGVKSLAFYFAGADERAWVYFDGKYIGGQHEGDVGILWQRPFTVMLPENTQPGTHQLAVKVIDSAGDGGLYRDVFLVAPK